MPTTPITSAPSSGVHHGELLADLKPNSFTMAGNKMLFEDPSGNGLMAASRSMSSLMASQFGAKDHSTSVLHLPPTFATYHSAPLYECGPVERLATLHAHHQHAQQQSVYHGHIRDQAFSNA